eukprot:TRINITY_DN61363_c0_g1_i1.p1 TRINITY_DN61363_c0_g1~~TRINITY_DN61363_c0_g1_i1.p1  ORF type:complete len:124 (+),score=22.83 TRINITY_DN61363_c0_g1_i1:42-413(+)
MPVVTLAERKAQQRAEKLENLAVALLTDLKRDCQVAHGLGRRELTWGSVVPCIETGSDADMDEVLAYHAKMMAEHAGSGGFTRVEWCQAKAPTTWVDRPARFGGHMQIRVYWDDDAEEYLGRL